MERTHRFTLEQDDLEHLLLGGTLEMPATNADTVHCVLAEMGTSAMQEAVDVVVAASQTGCNEVGNRRLVQ